MSNYIFVYGTLMHCFNNDMSRILRQSTDFLGKGCLCGTLYDLGSYPGVFLDLKSKNVVHGEIYKLKINFEIELLKILDAYEGITGGMEDEYYRTKHPVRWSNGKFDCWVYLLRNLPEKTLIAHGDYEKYLKETKSLIKPKALGSSKKHKGFT